VTYAIRPISDATRRMAKTLGAEWSYYDPYNPGLGLAPDLVVDGPREVDTGLVDLDGHSIVRLQDPIGFHRFPEKG
jgi:hypothetical protein